ncbi:MAG: circadian clock KaiB family protein [Sulfobacillus sp.]
MKAQAELSPFASAPRCRLRLYVAGLTACSTLAITNVSDICEREMDGQCDLEVIDLYQQPELAQRDQILAIPTLVKTWPLPVRSVIGDLSQRQRVLTGLGLLGKR